MRKQLISSGRDRHAADGLPNYDVSSTEHFRAWLRTGGAVIAWAAVLLVLLATTCATAAQDLATPAKAGLHPPDPEQPVATELRWKFEVGDNIRVRQRVTTNIVGADRSHYRNLQYFQYLWSVRKVDAEGTAIIDVRFERVQARNEYPPLRFDSQLDDPTVEPSEPPDWKARIYELRSMAESQFTITVSPRGAVLPIHGAEAVFGARAYTPGDMPALPEKSVKVGDVWEVEIGDAEMGMAGRASYKLVGEEIDGARRLLRIEGRSMFAEQDNTLFADNRLGDNISVCRFDPHAGRMVDEHASSETRVQLEPERFFNVKIENVRRLEDADVDSAAEIKSGEYYFAFAGETVNYAKVAGVARRTPADEPFQADGLMCLIFYHGWEDADHDGIPIMDELSGLTTKFDEGEPINFVVLSVGMQSAKLKCDVLDQNGEQLLSNRIPIPSGESAYAIRRLNSVPTGVYHIQFYVNDRFLIRVPVQVVPSVAWDD